MIEIDEGESLGGNVVLEILCEQHFKGEFYPRKH